ncbi:MAG TPA: hypothetical protein VF088_06180 [Pyrinomonadaceae bacterium]
MRHRTIAQWQSVIVMKYVEGVTLRSCITPEGMWLERAGNLIKQIGSALAAAHEKGILHRDLKPENKIRKNLLMLLPIR